MNFDQIPYNLAGLSVIPIGPDKRPLAKWKADQSEIINHDFSTAFGVGLCCGAISGNVQAIDFDLKYDLSEDKTLLKRYAAEVEKIAPGLIKKLVLQKTISGG